MWLRYGQLHKHQGEEREYRRLHEPHKRLKEHDRNRKYKRQKRHDNRDQHFAREDIAEEPEGKRYEAR